MAYNEFLLSLQCEHCAVRADECDARASAEPSWAYTWKQMARRWRLASRLFAVDRPKGIDTVVAWHTAKKLPPSRTSVLAVVTSCAGEAEQRYIVHAWYARLNECPLPDDLEEFDGCTEGPDGEIYLPEGWVETSAEGETDWSINGTVTHWAPMPALPPSINTAGGGER